MSQELGSLWNKWDLHFHTPSSYDYDNNSVTDVSIVESLVKSKIRVVAITDHHVIDVERINNLKEIAGDRLTILPGIELRSDQGGKPIHYICIFSEDCDLDYVWGRFKGILKLDSVDILAMGGDDKVYVPIENASKLVKELGGLISIHAGGKTNSINEIKNREQFQQRIKFDITEQYVDILEISQIKDIQDHIDIIFPATGLVRPMVIGSDNHNINDYQTKTWCWIKADPTFRGLRQTLKEPAERVYIGDIPQSLTLVEQNKTKFIGSISIAKKQDSTLPEHWFNQTLKFNSGLVAIIGNKGSGKSALADILGLLGNSRQGESFEFLNKDKFRHPKNNLARHFEAGLTWISGDVGPVKNLDTEVDSSQVEVIKYIPQNHLEAICNELKGGQDGRFQQELKSVIFSHVPSEKRLKTDSLEELIEFRTQEIIDTIELIKDDLDDINKEVVRLEGMVAPSYKKSIESRLAEKNKELEAHQASKPQEVAKPEADPATQAQVEKLNKQIDGKSEELASVDLQIQDAQKELEGHTRKIAVVEKLLGKIANLRQQFENFKDDAASEAAELGVSLDVLASLKIDDKKIRAIKESSQEKKEALETSLKDDNESGFTFNKAKIQKTLAELRQQLDHPNQKYQAYLAVLDSWEKKKQGIIGSPDISDSLEGLKVQLSNLNNIKPTLEAARKKQIDTAVKIHSEKQKISEIFSELYSPVQEFISSHRLAREQFQLEFNVTISDANFAGKFLDYINQGKRGSFYGSDDGALIVRNILAEADFQTKEGIEQFLRKIMDYLLKDKRDTSEKPNQVSGQLKREYSAHELYNFLYALDFIEPRYFLRWEGNNLEQLSPGERGTLLLIFYLLIDGSKTPLVIDQPEGNLDNHTVAKILVDCIREAKKNRQVFIVTHNPNLAVVCDAEQVVCATMNKADGNQITYSSGALESPVICEQVVKILEGSRPVFDLRDFKYKVGEY